MKTLYLFLCFLFSAVVTGQDSFQIKESFRTTPKNIIFGAFVPGSSHVQWVLRFLDELALRGHNVTFATVDENLKYGKAYSRLTTVSIGAPKFKMEEALNKLGSDAPITVMLPAFLEVLTPSWKPGFETIQGLVESNNANVIICDHFSDGCIDAAINKKLPLVLTSTMALYPDAATAYINGDMATMAEFTTKHQSLGLRLYNKFYLPLTIFPKIKSQLEGLAEIKREAGLVNAHYTDRPEAKTKDALKIVSSVFGLDTPRPVGPLVELVGPLFSAKYQGLDTAFADFLDKHNKVVYVAFGQHAKPIPHDVTLVLTALIHQYEKGHINGIIWSSGNAVREKFPATVTSTYSGKIYDIAAMFDKGYKKQGLGEDLFITKWSPQMAVLLHPSVSVFISHGGSNSLIESLHAQKRLIFYPFFGDQPGTAKQLSEFGLSEYFDKSTSPIVIEARVEKVILDVDGQYQHHVRRYQALVQIHSKAAPSRAADLIEEAAFTTQGPLFPHRHDVGLDLPFLKRYNLDLYAILVVLIAIPLGLFSFVAFKLARRVYLGAKVYQKMKTL